jgi:hypothetical protein
VVAVYGGLDGSHLETAAASPSYYTSACVTQQP